jgi:hypothetical protein
MYRVCAMVGEFFGGAARLTPTATIESIIAWLDAGQPDPDLAASQVRQVIAGVITAVVSTGFNGLPPTA